MRKIIVLVTALIFQITGSSQQIVDLQENAPYSNNGLEYGYYISNESSKEVKGEDYDRFEVNLYVTNKSGCLKLIPFKNNMTGSAVTTNTSDDIQIAEFNCTNATGKKFTAKKGTINAKPFYLNVRMPDQLIKDKYTMVNAQLGYAIRNGQTLTVRIITIVPKRERPKINCRIIYLPDVQ
jgi:hypothetical protein